MKDEAFLGGILIFAMLLFYVAELDVVASRVNAWIKNTFMSSGSGSK